MRPYYAAVLCGSGARTCLVFSGDPCASEGLWIYFYDVHTKFATQPRLDTQSRSLKNPIRNSLFYTKSSKKAFKRKENMISLS